MQRVQLFRIWLSLTCGSDGNVTYKEFVLIFGSATDTVSLLGHVFPGAVKHHATSLSFCKGKVLLKKMQNNLGMDGKCGAKSGVCG